MNPGAFKVIIIGIILTVLAFVVGSQAAESSRESLVTLGGIGFLFLLLVMGRRCWWLFFLLPAFARLVPMGVLSNIGIAYLLSPIVLVYWIIMWAMGYVRITWHKLFGLDLLVLLIIIYTVCSYIRTPVSIGFLTTMGFEAENLGGEAYAVALMGTIYYITLSLIPTTRVELGKVLKLGYFCTCAALLLGILKNPTNFSPLCSFVLHTLLCYYPCSKIFLSPWKFILLTVGFLGLLRGQRSAVASLVVFMLFMSALWKNLTLMLLLGATALGTVYYASSQKLLLELPTNMQRPLASLPGIQIDKETAAQAEHSSEWRYVMWRWAVDPRSGYIRNYVWGDGCAQSVADMNRESVMLMRGTMAKGDQTYFAERGVWHNGAIDVVHRLGFVGLALFVICQLAAITILWKICRATLGTPFGFFFAFSTATYVSNVFAFYVGDGHIQHFYMSFSVIVFLKVVYGILQKDGIIPPFFQRHFYVPLAIREHETAQQRLMPPSTPPIIR